MSSSSSDTESQSYQSDDSEWNYIPGPYNIEKTSASGENGSEMRDSNSHHEGNVGPYQTGKFVSRNRDLGCATFSEWARRRAKFKNTASGAQILKVRAQKIKIA